MSDFADEDAGKDNRNVTDDSENQKMSREDLVDLRRSGATGEVGITMNSTTALLIFYLFLDAGLDSPLIPEKNIE